MTEQKELPTVTLQRITRNPDGVQLDESYVQVKAPTVEEARNIAKVMLKEVRRK